MAEIEAMNRPKDIPTDQGRPSCYRKHKNSIQEPATASYEDLPGLLECKSINMGSCYIRRRCHSYFKHNSCLQALISTVIWVLQVTSIASEPTLEQNTVWLCSLLWNLLVLLHIHTEKLLAKESNANVTNNGRYNNVPIWRWYPASVEYSSPVGNYSVNLQPLFDTVTAKSWIHTFEN